MLGVRGVVAVVFVVLADKLEHETARIQLHLKEEGNVMERLMKHNHVTLPHVLVSSIQFMIMLV